MVRRLLPLILLCALSGCAYLGYLKDPFSDIPNFAAVNGSLFRGGQPRDAGWERLRALGIKTVVNLRGDNPGIERERSRAADSGMRFIHIPMSVFDYPSDEQALRFLEAVLAPQDQPVFVYCGSGRDRTGAMVAMYRVVVDGWTIKQAYREARQLGFWPYHGREAHLKAFVHQLKDKPSYFEKAREFRHADKP